MVQLLLPPVMVVLVVVVVTLFPRHTRTELVFAPSFQLVSAVGPITIDRG